MRREGGARSETFCQRFSVLGAAPYTARYCGAVQQLADGGLKKKKKKKKKKYR
jgi:hypothetical protein